ncbi:hypothetical protein A3762_07160 [Oleiphilus sp. HI0125]|uniref:tol-pal system protein YbgF n=1 Tax=Oleiphilus sp. HI0125 TaxID=1822266 RepID=UPI0007C4055D|nr:tol-pal system protein YbgF [Oleiphilus sp. HI0125]KZZ58762.1 hypothetical protein A3762_07160 [Oleiphilus sp. HI0125]
MLKYSKHRKGLLTKSFFVSLCFALSASVSAKTLIFQSKDNSASEPVYEQESGSQVQASTPSAPVAPAVGQTSNINSELFFIVEELKQEVMSLRGAVEEQAFEIRQLKRQSLDRYKDLDSRLQEVAKARAESVSVVQKPELATASSNISSVQGAAVVPVVVQADVKSAAAPAESAPSVDQDQQKLDYQNAYAYVTKKDFPAAVDALHAFVEKYPDGDLTGNAFYWLGEVYLVLPQLEQAKQAFSIVVKTFPGHRKLSDATYKLGVTYDRLQQPAEAERYLKMVQEKFPNSTAAKLAKSYTISR